MPTIRMKLNAASIEKAVQEVKAYRRSVGEKAEILRQRVAQEVAALAETGFNSALYDDILRGGPKAPDVLVEVENGNNVSLVIAYGKEAVFVEFGAGVSYNGAAGSSPHPMGQATMMLIGTYGKGYGAREVWGYYEDGELKLTRGTPASMPMYLALQEVAARVFNIAKEVFGGDSG